MCLREIVCVCPGGGLCVCVFGGGLCVCVQGDADDTQHLKHRIRKM